MGFFGKIKRGVKRTWGHLKRGHKFKDVISFVKKTGKTIGSEAKKIGKAGLQVGKTIKKGAKDLLDERGLLREIADVGLDIASVIRPSSEEKLQALKGTIDGTFDNIQMGGDLVQAGEKIAKGDIKEGARDIIEEIRENQDKLGTGKIGQAAQKLLEKEELIGRTADVSEKVKDRIRDGKKRPREERDRKDRKDQKEQKEQKDRKDPFDDDLFSEDLNDEPKRIRMSEVVSRQMPEIQASGRANVPVNHQVVISGGALGANNRPAREQIVSIPEERRLISNRFANDQELV